MIDNRRAESLRVVDIRVSPPEAETSERGKREARLARSAGELDVERSRPHGGASSVAASSESSSGGRALVLAALFSLYVIWGSTYYAMRVALVTLPPYSMAAVRFAIAGV